METKSLRRIAKIVLLSGIVGVAGEGCGRGYYAYRQPYNPGYCQPSVQQQQDAANRALLRGAIRGLQMWPRR